MKKLFYIGPKMQEYKIHMIFYRGNTHLCLPENVVAQHVFTLKSFNPITAIEICQPQAREFARYISAECEFTYYTIDIFVDGFAIKDTVIYKKASIFE